MSRLAPERWAFAERLTEWGTRGREPSQTERGAAFFVCQRLCAHLATFMGDVGIQALQSRALELATADVAWLSAVSVKADGSLGGLDAPEADVSPAEHARAAVALLARLVDLLATFIGEELTLQLVREAWPDLPLDLPGSGKGRKT